MELWIKNELIPKIIKDKFDVTWKNKKQTSIVDIDVKQLTTADAFMLTECFKIKVKLSNDEPNNKKIEEKGLVLKTSPNWPPEFLENANFRIAFRNETIAYTDMFSTLDWNEYLPKYYYSHIKDNDECVIVLSDFTFDGYRMSKAKGKLSLEHIYEAVKLLGRFHGFTYAFKFNDPAKFNAIINKFEETRYIEGKPYDEPYRSVINNSIKRTFQTVRKHCDVECKEITEEFMVKLQKIMEDPQEYQRIMFQPREPYATLVHGDFIRNNIAYKYTDEEFNTPESVVMFDFQTIRYASPMTDLITFMANSTGVDVRSKHFDYIFNTYYNELIKTYCEKTNIKQEDLPEFLSHSSLLIEYGRYMPFGLSIAAGFIAWCLAPGDFNIADNVNLPVDELLKMEFEKGGEIVNRELRALTYDIYHFYQKHNIEL